MTNVLDPTRTPPASPMALTPGAQIIYSTILATDSGSFELQLDTDYRVWEAREEDMQVCWARWTGDGFETLTPFHSIYFKPIELLFTLALLWGHNTRLTAVASGSHCARMTIDILFATCVTNAAEVVKHPDSDDANKGWAYVDPFLRSMGIEPTAFLDYAQTYFVGEEEPTEVPDLADPDIEEI